MHDHTLSKVREKEKIRSIFISLVDARESESVPSEDLVLRCSARKGKDDTEFPTPFPKLEAEGAAFLDVRHAEMLMKMMKTKQKNPKMMFTVLISNWTLCVLIAWTMKSTISTTNIKKKKL